MEPSSFMSDSTPGPAPQGSDHLSPQAQANSERDTFEKARQALGGGSGDSDMTKGDASKAVEAVFDAITASLKKGGEVRLVGFGTFAVSKRKASTGRNPRTGETMTIAASNQPKFKAGKALKDAVN